MAQNLIRMAIFNYFRIAFTSKTDVATSNSVHVLVFG